MQTKVDAKIQENPKLAAAVAQATNVLAEEVGSAVDQVSATWNLGQNENGDSVIELELRDARDFQESTIGKFSPQQLSDLNSLPSRLNRLWDKFLGVRLRKHLARLRVLAEQLEGD